MNTIYDALLGALREEKSGSLIPIQGGTSGTVAVADEGRAYLVSVTGDLTLSFTAAENSDLLSFFLLLDMREGIHSVTLASTLSYDGTPPVMTSRACYLFEVTGFAGNFVLHYKGKVNRPSNPNHGVWWYDSGGEVLTGYQEEEYLAEIKIDDPTPVSALCGRIVVNPGGTVGNIYSTSEPPVFDGGTMRICVAGGMVGTIQDYYVQCYSWKVNVTAGFVQSVQLGAPGSSTDISGGRIYSIESNMGLDAGGVWISGTGCVDMISQMNSFPVRISGGSVGSIEIPYWQNQVSVFDLSGGIVNSLQIGTYTQGAIPLMSGGTIGNCTITGATFCLSGGFVNQYTASAYYSSTGIAATGGMIHNITAGSFSDVGSYFFDFTNTVVDNMMLNTCVAGMGLTYRFDVNVRSGSAVKVNWDQGDPSRIGIHVFPGGSASIAQSLQTAGGSITVDSGAVVTYY